MTRFVAGLLLLLILAVLGAVPRQAHAAENYDNCTGFITALPAVISTPGTWCFKQDLNTALTNVYAIDIQANDVTIDCNGFKLGGLAAGTGTNSTGINAYDHPDITIRNCTIRGFLFGINLAGATRSVGGHLVEDNRFDANTAYGILANGDGSTVRRNLVTNTGGSTIYSQAEAIGAGFSVDILDNTISGVTSTASSSARGIETSGSDGSISGNRISDLVNPSQSVAIFISVSTHATVRNNTVIGNQGFNSYGVYCSTNSSNNDIVRDNEINGFGSAITNCTDGGGNDNVF